MAFTVVSQITITATATGSGFRSTDRLDAYYKRPSDNAEILIGSTNYSVAEYQQGITFTPPSESIWLGDPGQGSAYILLRGDSGDCDNQPSQLFNATGILLEEGGGGGGGGSTCYNVGNFTYNANSATACLNGNPQTLYSTTQTTGLSGLVWPLYTDAGCTTLLTGQVYISDGNQVRYLDNGTLGDPQLC